MFQIECRDWDDTVLEINIIEDREKAWAKYQALSVKYPYVTAYDGFNQVWCSKSLWAFRKRRTPEFPQLNKEVERSRIQAEYVTAEIERRRLELNDLVEALGILHPDVLAKSEQLDELILHYMKCKKPTA